MKRLLRTHPAVEPSGVRLQVSPDAELLAFPSVPPAEPGQVTAVLLHGIGMTHRTWAEMQPKLAGTLPTVSFDLPGFGGARDPSRHPTIAAHARAVDSALRRLGAGRCVLVGHSMGAQFAVELALLREVAGLVLIGPVVDPSRRRVVTQARDLGLDMLREPPGVNARVLTDYFHGGVGWYLQNLRPMMDYPIEERIRQVRCPVAVVRGENDPVARDGWCRRLAAAAGGPAEVVTISGVSHVVPLTAADAAAAVVRRLAAG